MLRQLQEYLASRGEACQEEIAIALGMGSADVEPMLRLLEARGRVRRLKEDTRPCAGCARCHPGARTRWRWVMEVSRRPPGR